jgi:uncharacterized protein YodC (DUF2158 family)
MATTFKVGDLVQLKSGGPVMTAGQPAPGREVTCYWFVGDEARKKRFAEACLQAVEADGSLKPPKDTR